MAEESLCDVVPDLCRHHELLKSSRGPQVEINSWDLQSFPVLSGLQSPAGQCKFLWGVQHSKDLELLERIRRRLQEEQGRAVGAGCDSRAPAAPSRGQSVALGTPVYIFRWFLLITNPSVAPGAGMGGSWLEQEPHEPCASPGALGSAAGALRPPGFGVDAHSLARAVSTCFYELPHAGWWLRAPRPHPSGGGVTVGITAGCVSPSPSPRPRPGHEGLGVLARITQTLGVGVRAPRTLCVLIPTASSQPGGADGLGIAGGGAGGVGALQNLLA